MIFKYRGFVITQPSEEKLVIRKVNQCYIAEFDVDHYWTPDELRILIDEYGECISAEEKMWEYEGYTLVQTGHNWHFAIYDKDGNFAMQVSCTQPLTDEEAIQNIKDLIKFREGKL